MAPNLTERETVPASAFVPCPMRVGLEQLARQRNGSLSAELRRALGFYIRAAERWP
jgi:hypothetical protein